MTLKDSHQKHAKLNKPDFGDFGRLELGFLGTSCGFIQAFVQEIIEELSSKHRFAYVDADHKEGDKLLAGEGHEGLMQNPDVIELRDKIVYKRLDMRLDAPSVFDQRQWLDKQDLILINANHFTAKAQVLIIDPKKSLENKLDRLTNVQLILLKEGVDNIPSLVKAHLPEWENIPCYRFEETPKILSFVADWMENNKPPVYGLVLAGGKSTRMHKDKGTLAYHGKDQRTHTMELLEPYCKQTFLSCNPEQASELTDSFPLVVDKLLGMGPLGGIISAFMDQPNVAWMTLACDLPFMDHETLRYLLEQRNPSKLATAFLAPDGVFPEPLITLWEPRAYPVLMQFLSQGYSCPRKVLINADIALLQAPDARAFQNINNPDEYKTAFATLNKKD